ncbi:sensor histidine kinase [Candidatus Nitrosocosmicus arcticus]|uniref:histidine kinase n=1 Tax=Candidatus Nitrosocosmicus arcticus TaxID=2035267 RepID=A0A557SW90_9ARCH|nr:HAMP domain-containing sensor histidine kinase [Candidatus Nitrosocosmicus arcticus]TVP40878.1 putative Signal transduction histidine kinase with phosphoacceptor and ATP binding domain [Candidatus Nitrosocosmicus arcticus]
MGKPFLFVRKKEIIIVSIILLIAGSYSLLLFQQSIAEQNIRDSLFLSHRNNQIEITKGVSEHSSSDLRLIGSILQGLSDSNYLQQGELYGDRVGNLIEERFNQINNISKVDGLFIADKNNIITYNKVAEGQRSFVNINISLRDYVNETRSTLNPVFSNGFKGIDGTFKIALTYPLINKDTEEYLGMVGVEIPSVDFFARYGNVYNIDSQFLVAYDKNSNYISTPRTNFLGKSIFSDEVQRFFNFNDIQNKYYQNVFYDRLFGGYAIYDFGTGERLNTGYPVSVDKKSIYFVFIITPTASVYSDINETLFAERSKFFLLIAGITAAIVILVLFLVKLNSILNERIKRRTKDLEESNKLLKIANEQLNVHDNMQKEFINIAAHELRTPTQAISGNLELIKMTYVPSLFQASSTGQKNNNIDKDFEKLFKDKNRLNDFALGLISTYRNAQRLEKLVNNILDISRIESNRLELHKESFNLNEKIQNVIKDVHTKTNLSSHHANSSTPVDIVFEPQEDPITVFADKIRIFEVLSNLINNAIKFSNGKPITISAKTFQKNEIGSIKSNLNSKLVDIENRRENKDKRMMVVVVSIRDLGKGIDSDILPRLFTKFATKSDRGTGLGLYIAKSIIEAHGGNIWAQNNYDGDDGATFSFSLPIGHGFNN